MQGVPKRSRNQGNKSSLLSDSSCAGNLLFTGKICRCRRLESLRQRWARIQQGQADFGTPAGNNTNSSPNSNGMSGGSSSTRVSSSSGQPTEQPSRRAAQGGHTEADAAFAALDDAIELMRPSVRRAAAAGKHLEERLLPAQEFSQRNMWYRT